MTQWDLSTMGYTIIAVGVVMQIAVLVQWVMAWRQGMLDRLSDAQDQNALLREENRRKNALLDLYERGRYQGDYQGEESDEILSAEHIGD